MRFGSAAAPPGLAPAASGTPVLAARAATKKWKPGGRWMFVVQQYCKNCTGIVNHVPSDCPELPGNEAIKVEMAERKAARIAKFGTAGRGGRGRGRG